MVVMHVWCVGIMGHSGDIAGEICVRHFFSQLELFCLAGTLWKDFGSSCSGICGYVGRGSVGLAPACCG